MGDTGAGDPGDAQMGMMQPDVVERISEEMSTGVTSQTQRLAFVCNRFGQGVVGGAETMVGELARGLVARGWYVDIITSDARDLYTWKNEFPTGVCWEDGLRVRRFEAFYEDSTRRDRDRIGQRILSWEKVSVSDQWRWMNAGVRVPEMYDYLVDHAAEYRAIIFAPYGCWTTVACAGVAPERTILLPCLHDEPEAHLDICKSVLEGSRGLWFLTLPELELAQRLIRMQPHAAVTGSGIHVPAQYDCEGFRERHRITGDFMLYAGRREGAKGWPELLRLIEFANSVLPAPIPLVTCGVGDVGAPPANVTVINLGYLDDEERSNAMAAASVYVQPSTKESFSRTVMEAWLAETPVIANGAGVVVSWHCSRSGGGLTYQDRYTFAEALRVLIADKHVAAALGRRGREYVLANYRWETVLDKVTACLEEWTCES